MKPPTWKTAVPVFPIVLLTLILSGWGYFLFGPHHFPHTQLTITTQIDRRVTFDAELASTPEEQKQGLMGRDHIAPDQAMIFPIPDDKVSMWMKDTLIPLDMLFVQNNHIVKIVRNAEPQSLALIDSEVPVQAVIEVGAGAVLNDDIHVGDEVKY